MENKTQTTHRTGPQELTSTERNFVRQLARQERESIGHVPWSHYERMAPKDRFLLIHCNGQPAGFCLWHHAKKSKRTIIRVHQIAIVRDARRWRNATELITRVIQLPDNLTAETITLRCAEELPANLFWRALGFEVKAALNPPNKRNRSLFVWEASTMGVLSHARAMLFGSNSF